MQRFGSSLLRQTRTMATITSLRRLSRQALSEKILAEQDAKETSYAIVDVRDSDHIGGHIKGSTNAPTHTLDAMMATLVRRFKDKKTVVFHCMLSQERGPRAALRYLRERDGLLKTMGEDPRPEQEVVVLEGGFQSWLQVYGTDERLTENFSKELWEGYF